MSEEGKRQLDKLFNSMPTSEIVSVFDNEVACGFHVSWIEKGTGFGEFTLALDKKTGEARVDDESMSGEWCGKLLMRLVGSTIRDIKDI